MTSVYPNYGRKLAYVNGDGLWLRRLDNLSAPALIAPGEDIGPPFWSPNSTDLAWFEKNSLKRAPVAGGRPASICQLPEDLRIDVMEGGAWMDDDTIIFTTGHTGLHRVSANGRNSSLVLPPGGGESAFRHASAVPGGKGVLFVVRRIAGQAEDDAFSDTLMFWNPKDPSTSKRMLFQRPGARLGFPMYSSSGHVVFADLTRLDQDSEPALWAMPVSPETLEPASEPFRLNESGRRPSISMDGTLAIVQATSFGAVLAPRQFVWVDRSGKMSAPFGPVQKGLDAPRLSPDERSVAFAAGPSLESFQTWVHDLVGGGSFPLRPEGKTEQMPAWMPGGREVAVIVDRGNRPKTIIRPLEGAGASKTVGDGELLHLSRSGQYALLRRRYGPTWTNYYVRLASEQSEWIPLPGGSLNLVNRRIFRPNLSPDDTILAFESDDIGRPEIWAVAFPGFTNRVQVSRDGGISPQWSRDGKELFFLSEDARSMMVAPVVNQNGRQFGPPTKLFDLTAAIYPGESFRRLNVFDVSADGQRFLMMYNVPDATASTSEFGTTVLLIENWFEEYREKR